MAGRTRIAISIIIYAIALLSVAAGVPKIIQMPQELEFMGSLGLSGIVVSALGIVQLVGGGLMFWPRVRFVGAILAALALLISSIALFASGAVAFALVSLVPALFACLVVYLEIRRLGRVSL